MSGTIIDLEGLNYNVFGLKKKSIPNPKKYSQAKYLTWNFYV